MRVQITLAALLLFPSGGAQLVAAQTDDRISKLNRPPVIDGTLRDPNWQHATVLYGSVASARMLSGCRSRLRMVEHGCVAPGANPPRKCSDVKLPTQPQGTTIGWNLLSTPMTTAWTPFSFS
jgi:hypothetical protein